MKHFFGSRRGSKVSLARVGTVGSLTLALIALGASLAFARAPSISVTAPHTVAAASKYTLKISGYFNCTRHNQDTGKCANVASVSEYKGSFKCTPKAVHSRRNSGTFVAGGVQDKKTRAKTPTTPGHFSASERVKAPGTAGHYTLCGILVNYPIGTISKNMATAHMTVNAPPAPTKDTLTVTADGGGDVFSADGAISCQGGDTCSHAYSPGSTVKLSAVAGDGRTFLGWSGACSGTVTKCTVTMNGKENVTAKFSTGGFATD